MFFGLYRLKMLDSKLFELNGFILTNFNLNLCVVVWIKTKNHPQILVAKYNNKGIYQVYIIISYLLKIVNQP